MNDLHSLLFIDIFDEAAHAALIAEVVPQYLGVILPGALIPQLNMHAGVQKSLFTQAGLQRGVIIHGGLFKNQRIRQKAHGGTCAAGILALSHICQLSHSLAALKALEIPVSLAVYLYLQPNGQRVHHRGAHAVQAAGYLVPAAAEFAAGMQNGENHRDCRKTGLLLHPHRDTAAVVLDPDDIAVLDDHVDFIAVTGQSLINRIVHNLVYQMMQPFRSGGSDIHTGAFAYCFQSFQYLYLIFIVVLIGLCNLVKLQVYASISRSLFSFQDSIIAQNAFFCKSITVTFWLCIVFRGPADPPVPPDHLA